MLMSKVSLLLVLFLQESIVNGRHSIQCGPSLIQSGQAILPNIPDFYFQPNRLSPTNDRSLIILDSFFTTYIFTVPPTNCSGDVVAMQYCYGESSIRLDSSKELFNFLVLEPEGGSQYRVVQSFLVQSSPFNRECRILPSGFDAMCCETLTLNPSARFNISTSSDFTYGITVHPQSDLLGFANSTMNVPQIAVQLTTGTRLLEPGTTVISISEQPSPGPLPLVRFQVDETVSPGPPPSVNPSINVAGGLDTDTTSSVQTSNAPSTNRDATSGTTTDSINQIDTGDNVLIIVIAAAVGATIVALLLLASIILIIAVCVTIKRSHRKSSSSDKPLPPQTTEKQRIEFTPNQAYNIPQSSPPQTTERQHTEFTPNQAYNIPQSSSSNKPLPHHAQAQTTDLTPNQAYNIPQSSLLPHHAQGQMTELTQHHAYNIPMDIATKNNKSYNVAPQSMEISTSTTDSVNYQTASVIYDYPDHA